MEHYSLRLHNKKKQYMLRLELVVDAPHPKRHALGSSMGTLGALGRAARRPGRCRMAPPPKGRKPRERKPGERPPPAAAMST